MKHKCPNSNLSFITAEPSIYSTCRNILSVSLGQTLVFFLPYNTKLVLVLSSSLFRLSRWAPENNSNWSYGGYRTPRGGLEPHGAGSRVEILL